MGRLTSRSRFFWPWLLIEARGEGGEGVGFHPRATVVMDDTLPVDAEGHEGFGRAYLLLEHQGRGECSRC